MEEFLKSPQFKKAIENIYHSLFDANYKSGNPRIPPHTHNGIDNLQIPATNISGSVHSAGGDGFVQLGVNDGSFTFDSNLFWDTGSSSLFLDNITSNSSFYFLSNSAFTMEATDNVLLLADGASSGVGVKVQTTSSSKSDITVTADGINSSVNIFGEKNVNIQSGTHGNILVQSGSGKNTTISAPTGTATLSANGSGGTVQIQATNIDSSILVNAGESIVLQLDNSNTGSAVVSLSDDNNVDTVGKVTLYGQSIVLKTNQSGAGGRIFMHNLPSDAYTADLGKGTIYIINASSAPADTPAQGGILYTESGALKYKGSSGTITTVAPA